MSVVGKVCADSSTRVVSTSSPDPAELHMPCDDTESVLERAWLVPYLESGTLIVVAPSDARFVAGKGDDNGYGGLGTLSGVAE